MSLSIYNARLLDPATGLDEPGAIFIDKGKIKDIANGQSGPHADAKESLATASRAAVAGGVTSFVVMPDTRPVVDDVALVRFIIEQARKTAKARIYPSGALTVGLKGEQMAEIGLMADAEAIIFTNGDLPIANASVMKRAMSYAASRNALVMSRPDERALSASGVMNAGALAARIGLSGIPPEAEWIGAARDIMLAETTGCRLVVDQVSTERTLQIIAAARGRGAKIHATVAAHTLFFNERDVGDYLTYCKVNPPFRDEETRQALIAALKRGEIDAVVSAHDPQPPEEKRLPFGEAAFGAAGLETTLSALMSLVNDADLPLLDALAPVTCRPADLLGLPQGRLKNGAPADLILFDPGKPWLCVREDLRSRSTNSPFDGRRLQGRVMRTLVGGETVFEYAPAG